MPTLRWVHTRRVRRRGFRTDSTPRRGATSVETEWSVPGRIEIDDVQPVVSCGAVSGQGRGRRDGPGPGHGVARRPRGGRGDPGGALPGPRYPQLAETAGSRPAGRPRSRPIRAADAIPVAAGQAAAASRWRRAGRRTCSTVSSPRTASVCGPSGWTAGAIRSRPGGMRVTPSSTPARVKPSCPTTS